MSRIITCINENNVSVAFSYDEDAMFFLYKIDGISAVKKKVSTSENTMTDGSTKQGSVTSQKNIVITAEIDANTSEEHQRRRDLLYSCFATDGTMIVEEGNIRRVIDYTTEDIDVDLDGGPKRYATISLICCDPMFKDEQDTIVTMAGWESGFEYIHEWIEEGEEYGSRTAEITKTIENDSAVAYIGMEITIAATGNITNPAIYHIEEEEHIQIGTEVNPFYMQSGDKLKITTGTNEKDVILIRGNEEINVNEYLDEQSEFIQLIHGKNTLTYAADVGRDYMDVEIRYRQRYLGV